MSISDLGFTVVPAILVICYLIGMGCKTSEKISKYIPVIVGASGGILGVIGMYVMPGFPAQDYLTAIAIGIVSGLAATGIHQIQKQLKE